MSLKDLYKLTDKSNVEKALTKNRRNIKQSNIFTVLFAILVMIYIICSYIFTIHPAINLATCFMLSLISLISWQLLTHRMSKYNFLSDIYEQILENEKNVKN